MDFILSLPFLVGLAVGAVGGCFVGIGLGRRSTTANEKYDELRAKYNALRDRYENKG